MYVPINSGRYMAKIIRAFTARHPGAGVELVDTGFQRDDLEWLRAGDVDMLATRLPATGPDLIVGPILSREQRLLLVSKDDPLSTRESVCLEDFAGRLVADTPAFRREMMDAFIPPVAPSGRRLAASHDALSRGPPAPDRHRRTSPPNRRVPVGLLQPSGDHLGSDLRLAAIRDRARVGRAQPAPPQSTHLPAQQQTCSPIPSWRRTPATEQNGPPQRCGRRHHPDRTCDVRTATIEVGALVGVPCG